MVQKNFEMRIGSRAQVFHGTAKQTSGGLQKCDLKKNKRGAIVSRRASARAKKENRLVKAGFVTQKGKFGVVQRGGINFNELKKDIIVKIKGDNYKVFEKRDFDYSKIEEPNITCWIMKRVSDKREFYLFKDNNDRLFCIRHEFTVEENNSLTAD